MKQHRLLLLSQENGFPFVGQSKHTQSVHDFRFTYLHLMPFLFAINEHLSSNFSFFSSFSNRLPSFDVHFYGPACTAVCVRALQHCLNIKTQLFVNKLYRNSFADDIRLQSANSCHFEECIDSKALHSASQPTS